MLCTGLIEHCRKLGAPIDNTLDSCSIIDEKSKSLLGVLTAEDGHYFNDAVIVDAVVNAIDAAHAVSVSLANIVNSRI